MTGPQSVMIQRAYECDSRSYYDTVDTILNAMLYDWKTHLNQPKHITVTQEKWMELEPFYPSLLSIYRYYATAGHDDASPHKDSPFLLHKTSFHDLITLLAPSTHVIIWVAVLNRGGKPWKWPKRKKSGRHRCEGMSLHQKR